MSFNIIPTEIFPGLIHFQFETQYEVTSTMMRLQEFYESPYTNIRNKVFDVETYMDTYAKNQDNFTYNTDWSGFNIPGNIVDEFFKKYKTGLLKKESHLKELIYECKDELEIGGKFYIVASYKDDLQGKDVLKHEIAHGLYYLNVKYKNEMMDIIDAISDKDKEILQDGLLGRGYTKHVILDEIQAYFATSEMMELCEDFETEKIPWDLVFKCKKTFIEYYSRMKA